VPVAANFIRFFTSIPPILAGSNILGYRIATL
jgi:hypothetical protein